MSIDFKLILEKTPSAYLVLLPNFPTFTIVAASDAYLSYTMTKREDIVGKALFDAFPDNPEDNLATGVFNLKESLERVIRFSRPDTMAVQKYDIRMPEKSGKGFEERYWSPVNSPVLNKEGQLEYIIHRVEDVTNLVQLKLRNEVESEGLQKELYLRTVELDKKNRELSKSHKDLEEAVAIRDEFIKKADEFLNKAEKAHEELNEFFMQTPIAMALLQGPDHVYTMVNPRFLETSGRNPLGLSVKKAFKPDEAHHYIPLLDEVYKTGKPFIGKDVPFPRMSDKGELENLFLEVHYHPFKDGDGSTKGVLAYILDVTEQVSARKTLEESKFQLEGLVSNLRDERVLREGFVSALTHDLRTPITAAKMVAQLIARKSHDPETVEKNANRISESMDRCDHMIRDLLDANRINAGQKIRLELSECDLVEITQRAVDELSTLHGDRFVIKASGPIRGVWSCQDIRRMLENLCSNAVKYGDSDSPVTISLMNDRHAAHMVVHNYGPRIKPDEQKHLFEPFKRASSAQAGNQRGWGLGLTLVRGIVQAHGGEVSVESSLKDGTSFSVHLPLITRSELETSH